MTDPTDPAASAERQHWISLLARAPAAELERHWHAYTERNPAPSWTRLRGPEPGMVMLRGRVGGDGQPFNMGEMTVTRCSVRLAQGPVGHGYAPGLADQHAELAAVVDGLMQDPAASEGLRALILEPLASALGAKADAAARRAAATQVEFFTLVRGA